MNGFEAVGKFAHAKNVILFWEDGCDEREGAIGQEYRAV